MDNNMTVQQMMQEMEEISNMFFIKADQFVKRCEDMPRYYDDVTRNMHHKMAKEHGHVFTIEQIRDVMQLVKTGKSPNADYSDDECNLWELLKYGC